MTVTTATVEVDISNAWEGSERNQQLLADYLEEIHAADQAELARLEIGCRPIVSRDPESTLWCVVCPHHDTLSQHYTWEVAYVEAYHHIEEERDGCE